MSERPIAVLGAGAWGTTLAIVQARAGRAVRLWTHRASHAAEMVAARENRRYLPGAQLPREVIVTSELDEAVGEARCILLVVPSTAMRLTARSLAGRCWAETILVSCAKGLEIDTHQRLSVVIAEELPSLAARIAVLSGPNLAREIVDGKPATSVVAALDPAIAVAAREMIMTPWLRIYTSTDLIGVELCGALKNVVALAAGISDGLGAGDNAKAAIVTRGLAEMARLGLVAGAQPMTFAGLAGVGDLMATCASPLSRNRQVGERLASDQPLEQIVRELGHVAEGIPTTRAVHDLSSELGVSMPITDQLYQILFAGKPVQEAIRDLMSREPRPEGFELSP